MTMELRHLGIDGVIEIIPKKFGDGRVTSDLLFAD